MVGRICRDGIKGGKDERAISPGEDVGEAPGADEGFVGRAGHALDRGGWERAGDWGGDILVGNDWNGGQIACALSAFYRGLRERYEGMILGVGSV